MATVYRAYQPSMDRYVAIKILPKLYGEDPTFLARFKQEARLIAQLQHPNILPVYDYGEAEGYTYLVMSYVEGGTLSQVLKNKPIDLVWICRVVEQIAGALDYAHSKGIIHRDVKPSNILLDERGNCLLTDFGLAKVLSGSPQFTASGTFLGTPTYASPEQCMGLEVDHRTDIYSLGVMLYEMATGRPPFVADTPMAVVIKQVHEPLPLPRLINPDLPESVERVILKALDKDPQSRYATASQMAEALVSAVRAAGYSIPSSILSAVPGATLPGQTVSPKVRQVPEKPLQSKPQPRRLTWIWIVALIACLAVLSGMLVAGYRWVRHNLGQGYALAPPVQATLSITPSALPGNLPTYVPVTEGSSQVTPAASPETPAVEAQPVPTTDIDMDRSPYAMALSKDGTIHLVWASQAEDQPCLRYTLSSDGGRSFAKPQEPFNLPERACASPAMAVSPDGILHIVWMEKGIGQRWSIFYASRHGTEFTEPIHVSEVASEQVNPALAISSEGEVFIAWQDNRSGSWRIYLTHFNTGGQALSQKVVFAPELPTAPADTGTQKQLALAAGRSGAAHLLWTDDRDGNWQVFYTRFLNGQFEPARVAGGGLMEDLGDNFPSILANPDGRVQIAWGNAYIKHPQYLVDIYLPVYAVSPDEKGSFSPPVQVGEGFSHVSTQPNETSLAAVPEKADYVALTTYSPRDGSIVWVYHKMIGETGFQPGVTVVQSSSGDVYHHPTLIADVEGMLHLAWAYQRGSEWDVFYAQSRDGGETFSTPFQVNQQ